MHKSSCPSTYSALNAASLIDPPVLDFVVAVNDQQVFEANFARSPILRKTGTHVVVRCGFASASAAYNSGMSLGTNELVVFCHQDVYLPAAWSDWLTTATAQLAASDPRWAVLGVFGATASGLPMGHVWSSGLQKVLGDKFNAPVPVVSLDEVLIVVRRSSALQFDETFPGYHLFGTDIVQQALRRGLGAYAIWAPVIHNSRPVMYLPREYFAAYDYVRRKWAHRLPIAHCISPIATSPWRHFRRILRARLDELRFGHIPRARFDRGLDCVNIARTQGFE